MNANVRCDVREVSADVWRSLSLIFCVLVCVLVWLCVRVDNRFGNVGNVALQQAGHFVEDLQL